MKIIIVTSDGKQRSFNAPLTREEEKELVKSIDAHQGQIGAYNAVAALIQLIRNWK
jgi:hypothetical protein